MQSSNRSFITILILSAFIIYGLAGTVNMLSSNGIPNQIADDGRDDADPAGRQADGSTGFHYDDFAQVLENHVNIRGEVNYKALKSDRGQLDAFLRRIDGLGVRDFRKWPENERLVFWINTYNALTLRLIIDHYPIKPRGGLKALTFPKNSIRQIPGIWEEPKYQVMGQALSLDEIEHRVLRVRFNDARIHMTIVCASVGCPYLRAEPFTVEKLDEQVNEQASRFFGDPEKFQVDHRGETIRISPIFKWFSEDFSKYMGKAAPGAKPSGKKKSIIWFTSIYRKDVHFPEHSGYKLEFLDYDWSLNDQF
jgi:hypothetical protein